MMSITPTEIYMLLAVTICFLSFFVLLVFRYPVVKIKNKEIEVDDPKPTPNIMEVFDYLGTKIIHENGTYTVNQKGRVGFYRTWDDLPMEYKKMVKELDSRSQETKSGDDYFLEIVNGLYYLTMPGGKKKKYNSLSEIPSHIRKALGK